MPTPSRTPPTIWLGAFVIALVAAVHLTPPAGLSPPAARAAVLVVFTIVAWATGLMKEPTTSLLFFLFAVLSQVAPASTIFSGLESSAWWLVFGGAIIGVAVRSSGLAERCGRMLVTHASASYAGCIAAVVAACLALAFVMPSTTGRVLLTTPIALSLCDRVGFGPGRPGRTGIVLAAATATYVLPTTILSANIPNSVLLGAAETLYGVHLHYGAYFLLHFPVLGALKALVLIGLIVRLFPDRIAIAASAEGPGDAAPSPRWSTGERRLLTVLVLSVVLYATDFLHGVSPAWVSLGAGLACLLPGVGIVAADDVNKQVQIGPLVYFAAFLGLGAIIASSGLGSWATHALLRELPITPGPSIANLAMVLAVGALIGLATTLPGLPAVLTPIAGDLAKAAGLPLYTVLMLQIPVFSTVFFPYQSPPMMIAMQLAGISIRDATRLCLALAAVTVIGLLPLDLAWWRVVGAF